MIAGQHRIPKIVACVLTALWLAACSVTPVDDRGSAAERAARQAYDSGSYEIAAGTWEQLAAESAFQNQSGYRLSAADAWLLAGRHDKARIQLEQVSRRDLPGDDAALYDLLKTEFALHNGDTEAAAFYLEVVGPTLPASLQNRYTALTQKLQQLQAGPSSRQLALAFASIRDLSFYQPDRALDILRLLDDVPLEQLRNLTADKQAASANDAWLRIALVLRETLFDGEKLESAVTEWALDNPGVILTRDDALDLGLRYRSLFRAPENVAVLLPAQGSMTVAGNAIRDGMLSAYMEQPGSTALTFYDAGSGPLEMVSAYFQALEDGADWVVGPLRRESVAQLASLPVFSTPALVLNQPSEAVQNGMVQGLPFYSMSLSQDEEAASIADKCLQMGMTRALVLVPDTQWGERMQRAFTTAFVEGEGEITASATFRTTENDHSILLKQLLKIDQSIERNRNLSNLLGINLEFEPARRDDFDVIFLAASPTQGRQIKPQLKFFDAGSKPVFATARIFAGNHDRAANQDLNGILFPITQWQLDVAGSADDMPTLDSIRNGQFGSLHAIGRDAWNVLPWLEMMRKDPGVVFPGALGELSIDQHGQLSRQPGWAVFSRGRPIAVDWPASP